MRFLDARTAAALLTCITSASSGQNVASPKGSAPALLAPNDEIVVTGRRGNSKYRLAPEFRPVTEDPADRSGRDLARDWLCHNVGPRGCPMKLDRLITFRSNGSVQIGDHGDGK